MSDRPVSPRRTDARRPRLLVGACGLLAALLGVVVMFGWHLQIAVVVRPTPGFPPMQYMTAIGLIVAGLGLAMFAFGRSRMIPALAGGFLATMGWLILGGYIADWQPVGEAMLPYFPSLGDMTPRISSPPTTTAFALCGTALLILSLRSIPASTKRLLVWILGSLSLALCVMVLAGYASGLSQIYVWGNQVGMALHTAVGMSLLSVGLLATRWLEGKALLLDRWLPVPVGLAAAVAAVLLWQALSADRRQAIHKRSEIIAQDLAVDSRVRLDAPIRAVERMQRRWEESGGIPREEWAADARSYLRDEKILSALAWVDAKRELRWEMPATQGKIFQLDGGLANSWTAGRALKDSLDPHAIVMSPKLEFADKSKGFLAYFPLYPRNTFDGFLVAAIRFHDLLEATLDEPLFENYNISVYEGRDLIFFLGGQYDGENDLKAVSNVDFHGHAWHFVVEPKSSSLVEGRLPVVILCLGLLLAVALAMAVRSFQQTASRNREVRRANRRLQKEMSDREVAERRQRESEARLQGVLNAATGVAVIRTDKAGLITYFSRGAERILGYRAEEMVGRHSPAIFHDPEELKKRGRELSVALGREVQGFQIFIEISLRKGSERREWTYVCKDGSRRTVDLTVTLQEDAGGHITGYLGTAVDVTEQKRIELRLRETLRAKESAQALLEAAGRIARLGHWELPLDGTPPRWSPTTYDIHEVPIGEPITLERAFDFFHPEDRPSIEKQVRHSMETGETFDFEARLRTARGREIWVHCRGEPARDESGQVVLLHGVLQDVDERRRAAKLLEERNAQLQVMTERAEANARAKAEFLANMSHEIRTPLNAMIGMSELLMDSRLEVQEREFVETIHTSGDILLSLINDILDFSKIESGQLDLERIPLLLRDCVEASLDMVGGSAGKKHLDLLYWIDPDVPPSIMGDPTRLRQVLVNLAANAIKFTSRGEVFVSLSMAGDTVSPRLHVAVRDTGIGIPEDRLDRLFSAFSQVDASTTREYGGTGLGLAISMRLIERMGGRIWVESEVGRGSTFQFEIPIEPVTTPLPTVLATSVPRSLAGLRILIVDDNVTNRSILRRQTESWEMLPTVVEDARQALKLIEEGQAFDLGLLDVMLPEMDGYELAAEIRKHRSEHDLPLLLLTSMGDRSRDLKPLGISGMLTKPVKTKSLFNALRSVLTQSLPIERMAGGEASHEELGEKYPLRILVAEDNSVNQRVISLLLERMGYHPEMVENGRQVLGRLEEEKFDLILLDVQMPEMDGLETARRICRDHPRDDRPWMIALTAHAVDGDKDDCLAAGMDDYLSKPVRRETLEAALRNAFRQHEATSRH